MNVDGYYNSLLSFIDKAVDEGFVSQSARHIIVSAPTAKELVRKLEVRLRSFSCFSTKEQRISYVSQGHADREKERRLFFVFLIKPCGREKGGEVLQENDIDMQKKEVQCSHFFPEWTLVRLKVKIGRPRTETSTSIALLPPLTSSVSEDIRFATNYIHINILSWGAYFLLSEFVSHFLCKSVTI